MIAAEFLSELARRALVISGLALFLEVLLPKGSLRKYARLVLGIMLVGALAEPVLDFLPGKAAISAGIFADVPGPADNTEEIIAAGGRLAEAAEAEAAEALAGDLSREIESLVMMQGSVADCEVSVEFADGDFDGAAAAGTGNNRGRVFIMLSVNENAAAQAAEVEQRVKDNVASFYGLPAEAVRVSVLKYGEKRTAG